MNTLKKQKKNKVMVAIGALLITSSAIAAAGQLIKHETMKVTEQKGQQGTFVPSTPTDSFVLDGSAQPKVEVNQLEWARCLVGQTFTDGKCTGDADEFTTWEAALAAPTTQQAAEGWRVPNIKELMLITENTQAFPAINTEVFPFALQMKFAERENSYSQLLPAAPSSPFIWSSTPVTHKTVKKDGSTVLSPEESAKRTTEARLAMEYSYALDLALGEPQEVYRSGESFGKRRNTQYSTPDPDLTQKARYVLLVKDIPKA